MKRKKRRSTKPPTKILLDLARGKEIDLVAAELTGLVGRFESLAADLACQLAEFKAENYRRSQTAFKAHETRRKNRGKEMASPENGNQSAVSGLQPDNQAYLDLDTPGRETIADEGSGKP